MRAKEGTLPHLTQCVVDRVRNFVYEVVFCTQHSGLADAIERVVMVWRWAAVKVPGLCLVTCLR